MFLLVLRLTEPLIESLIVPLERSGSPCLCLSSHDLNLDPLTVLSKHTDLPAASGNPSMGFGSSVSFFPPLIVPFPVELAVNEFCPSAHFYVHSESEHLIELSSVVNLPTGPVASDADVSCWLSGPDSGLDFKHGDV